MIRVIAAASLALCACGARSEPAAGAQGSAETAGSADAGSASTGTGAQGSAGAGPTPGRVLLRIVGFRAPRAVIHDPVADVYLVSNVNGDPAAADDDDNGFISRILPDGQFLDLKWIDGAENDALTLSAPMGMAIAGGRLWVADRNKLHVFDARTGRHRASHHISRATALADVVAVDRAVIASDNGTELAGGLFRLSASKVAISYLAPDQTGIGQPHGLFAPGDGSLWVTAGRELYRVEEGRRTAGAELPAGSLDGIVGLPGGDLLVASHDGTIFRGAPRPTADGSLSATWTPVFTDLDAPADIGLDARRRRLLIPLILANAVEVRELPAP